VASATDIDRTRPYDETRMHAPAYRSLLRQIAGAGPRRLALRVQREVDDRGCVFSGDADDQRFVVDPVPRIIAGPEWDELAAALAQRVEALERFVADLHGERSIVAAGVVPERVLGTADHHDPALRGLPVQTWITVAGLDLVRGADGALTVLEDNVRTPSGMAYLQAAREAVSRGVSLPAGLRLRTVDGLPAVLRRALADAAPQDAGDDPFVVLLSDGPANAAWWEHEALGRALDIPVVQAGRLRSVRDRLWLEDRHGRYRRQVDVVYRRTDEERLHGPGGGLTPLGELLAPALRAGNLAVANAFGTGVADDKLVHAYVEDMIRFYLGEQPGLRSVPTYDLCDPAARAEALSRLGELVVKPRSGHGGRGVVIGSLAGRDELRRVREEIEARPERFVAQDVVLLSEHPTVAGSELAPRHVDLRPFVVSGSDRRRVIPGGLTRVALEEGEMIVNSSRNGGAKDTWVLD
jgi:carboxylate-amine ligase